MPVISERYQHLQRKIRHACEAAGRSTEEIHLLAVSKRQPPAAVAELAGLGQTRFGENQIPEGSDKSAALKNQGFTDLEWHFIGALQSNKTRTVAEHFGWVQSVDRWKIARRLSEQRPDTLCPLNILIQVNIDDEPQKAGIAATDLPAFAKQLQSLPRICLRGLMVIPKPAQDHRTNEAAFRQANELYQNLQSHYPTVDTLSMGMSADFPAAIAAGSTMLRVGTELFGPRD